jgi:hypothetical protein
LGVLEEVAGPVVGLGMFGAALLVGGRYFERVVFGHGVDFILIGKRNGKMEND